MKKLAILFTALLTGAFFLSSCEKCTVCSHPDLTTGIEVVEEYCGTGSEVGRFETEWDASWDSLGGYCARN